MTEQSKQTAAELAAALIAVMLGAAAILHGAGATVPQLYVSSALAGDAARAIQTIVIDPPLTLARDKTTGLLHLGVALPTICNSDALGNTTCIPPAIPPLPAPPAIGLSYNETPAYDAIVKTWTLAHTPLSGAGTACWLNGLLQQPGTDYTLAGKVITSPTWQPTDPVRCQYAYAFFGPG